MSDRVGAIINKDIEVVKGRIGSFINNFMASANGCKMPYGPTMLGPFRSCMYPKILRSTNVRKAMAQERAPSARRLYRNMATPTCLLGTCFGQKSALDRRGARSCRLSWRRES